MISAFLLLLFVRAEEIKSIPTVEVYQADNSESCARRCMNIATSLNPKNDIREVRELFQHNCADKIERAPKEPNKIASEIGRCATLLKDSAKAKRDEALEYVFSGKILSDTKSAVASVPETVQNVAGQVAYTVQNADSILKNAYTAVKGLARNTTAATLETLRGFKEQLSGQDFDKVKQKCAQDDSCKLAVARGFLRFSERHPNGSYIVSDAEVLQTIKPMRFDLVLSKSVSESNQAKQECERLRSESMQSIFQKNNRNWPKDLESQLNRDLLAKNPACPFVLTQALPAQTAMNTAPPTRFSTLQMWSMVDSCFGQDTLEEINNIFCKEIGKEAALIAVGGVIGKSIQLGLKGLKARKLVTALREKRAIPPNHEVLSVIDNQVITKASEDGRTVYYKILDGKPPEKISMDPSGFAINARDGANRQLALADINSAQINGQAKSVLFIDVNNLGKVNYFKAGSQAGDQYLGEVARIVAEKTAGKGKVYRWGGDEFVVVLNETDKATIREINQSISDSVMKSPVLKSIFTAEKAAAAQRYKLLNPPRGRPSSITSYDELPQSFKDTLTDAEAQFARTNFEAFRARVKEIDGKAIRDSAAIQPSISMGAAITDGRKTPAEILAAADSQAAKVKKQYKSALGCDDTKKYTGRDAYLPDDGAFCLPRNLSARPQALEPD